MNREQIGTDLTHLCRIIGRIRMYNDMIYIIIKSPNDHPFWWNIFESLYSSLIIDAGKILDSNRIEWKVSIFFVINKLIQEYRWGCKISELKEDKNNIKTIAENISLERFRNNRTAHLNLQDTRLPRFIETEEIMNLLNEIEVLVKKYHKWVYWEGCSIDCRSIYAGNQWHQPILEYLSNILKNN